MKIIRVSIPVFLTLALSMLWTTASEAALCTSLSSGNWNVAGRWSCGNVPVNGDDVTIANGHTVTLNVNSANLGTLTINAGGILQGDGTGKLLSVGQDGGTDVLNNGTLNFSGATDAIIRLVRNSRWSGNGTWNLSFLNLNNRTLSFPAGASMTLNLDGAGNAILNPGAVASLSTVTWNYNGTAAQTTSPNNNVLYGNLTANNAAGLTLARSLTTTNLLGNLSVQSGIFNDGAFSITGLGTKTFSVSNGATFDITYSNGMVTGFTSNTFGATSTVDYARNGAQPIGAETYGHLILSGGNTKTPVAGTTTIAGNFTLSAGVTYAGNTNNPIVNLAGNFTNSGTFTSGTGLFTFNGASAQTLTGATTFTNMQMNNSTGLTINNNVTVSSVLTLTSGAITTGANTLIVTASCGAANPSRPAGGGWVNGNLRLTVPSTNPVTCIFHVGDANNYAPITVTKTGTNTGTLTGMNTTGDHADTTTDTSGIDKNKSVNRFWTLTGGTLVSGTPYSAIFQFCDAIGTGCGVNDVDAGANTANFIVAKKTSGSWTIPTVGARTSISTEATGLNTFGEFAVGEPLALNHYAISHSSDGVSCQAEPVTVTAHDAAHGAVTLSSAKTITLSTATGLGDWSLTTGLGTLNNGTANDGIATYQFGNESSVVLSLKHTTPGSVNINITDGTVTETSGTASGPEDLSLVFAPAGFRFTDGTNPVTIGAQIAGKESNLAPGAQSLYLQAIRTDTVTGACVGVFANGTTVNVGMASQCNNPTTCIAGKQVSITNNATTTAIASNPNTGVSSYTSVALLFGANSQALFSFTYPDAGSISLHVRYNIPLGGGGASPDNMLGSSAAFVVRPFGFRISDPPSGRTGASSAVFTTAGTNFNTTLTAVVWETADDTDNDGVPDNQGALAANAATPNFGQETAAAAATLSHALAEPAGGTAGSLTGSTSFTGFTSGAKTQSVAYDNVGIIRLLATTSNYLGGGQDVTAGPSTAGLTGVGRFIPHHFDVTKIDGCTGGATFTYSGQPFTVTVTAKNLAGGPTDITSNYDGTLGFSKAVTISNAGTTTNFANHNITAANFAGGIRNQTTVTYTYPVASKETVTASLTLRAMEDGGGDSVSSVGYTENAAEIRSGRVRIINAYGSELVLLSVPMRVEHYSSDGWVTNTGDTCTSLGLANLDLQNAIHDPAQGVATININAGPPVRSSAVTPVSPSLGEGQLNFSAPTAGGFGYADARIDLSGNSWLRYDWNGDSTDDDPTGRATFGLYQGSPRHIYQRERY